MTDQTMTIESPLEVGGVRVNLSQLRDDLEADGFTVISTTTIPEVGGVRFRIVATYPAQWLLSGWKKGRV